MPRFQPRVQLPLFVSAIVVILVGNTSSSSAQAKCATTFECAQQAVDAAARVDAALQALQTRIAKVEALGQSLGNGRILAIAEIKNGKVYFGSPGTSFDQRSGVFSFSNPGGLAFVPVVSDSKDADYITQTHWIQKMIPPDKFILKAKSMGTGADTYAPHDFTVVVIGFVAVVRP